MNDYIIEESSDKEALARKLAEVLGDAVVLKFTAHGYHWNVKGHDFREFHAFFGEIYEDVDGSIDVLAENILKLGFDAPYLLEEFLTFSCIKPVKVSSGDRLEMTQALIVNNLQIIGCLNEAFAVASAVNEQGIANFLAERIDAHQKWNWQLSATLGASAQIAVDVEEEPYDETSIAL